ncbi:MAG: hypothetical protein R3324_10500, partial [Halobacteriales archaeon]|nr:hypothetical protein [Halobacteriales archaeon]
PARWPPTGGRLAAPHAPREGLMFGIETLGGTAQAAAKVGLVLVESIVLYVWYGALDRTLGTVVLAILGRR